MISTWGKSLQGPATCLMVAQSREPVICAKGMSINPHVAFDECPQLDCLLVPGGQGTRTQVDNAELICFVAGQAKGCQAVLFRVHRLVHPAPGRAACRRRATTHWASLARLAELGGVTVVQERVVATATSGRPLACPPASTWHSRSSRRLRARPAPARFSWGAEYYPSGRFYGSLHQGPQAPAYLKRPLKTQ